MHCAVCPGKRRIYGRSTGEAQFVRENQGNSGRDELIAQFVRRKAHFTDGTDILTNKEYAQKILPLVLRHKRQDNTA